MLSHVIFYFLSAVVGAWEESLMPLVLPFCYSCHPHHSHLYPSPFKQKNIVGRCLCWHGGGRYWRTPLRCRSPAVGSTVQPRGTGGENVAGAKYSGEAPPKPAKQTEDQRTMLSVRSSPVRYYSPEYTSPGIFSGLCSVCDPIWGDPMVPGRRRAIILLPLATPICLPADMI